MALVLTGCYTGLIITHFRESSASPGELHEKNPLRGPHPGQTSLATLVVPYLATRDDLRDEANIEGKDWWRIYQSGLEAFVEELRTAGFKVIQLSIQRQRDLGLFARRIEMTEDEYRTHLEKLRVAGGGDAIIAYNHSRQTGSQLLNAYSMAFVGTVSVPSTMKVELLIGPGGNVLYQQAQDVKLSLTARINNATDADLLRLN